MIVFFYGVIFSQSTLSEVATFVPIGHGYTDWLYGKVVDMFYFPLFEFNWPAWMPFIGGMILLKIISSLFGKVRLIGYVCFNTNHNEDENSVSTYYMSIVTCFQQSTIRPSGDSGKGA